MTLSRLFILFIPLTLSAMPEHMPHNNYSNLTLCGDVFSAGLPLIGIGAASIGQDKPLSKVIIPAATIASVGYSCDMLKRCFRDTEIGMRPNGYHSSFPSAHSAYAFAGARLIHRNWGDHYGTAAYGLATMTALSRVEGDYHHYHDVIAGAALAIGIETVIHQFGKEQEPKNFEWVVISTRELAAIGFELSF